MRTATAHRDAYTNSKVKLIPLFLAHTPHQLRDTLTASTSSSLQLALDAVLQ